MACTPQPKSQEEELYSLLEGTFNSAKQAEQNSEYYNITLHLAHIWEEREGLWIYAEYGLSNNPAIPYDQRVFKITNASENIVTLESYEILEPKNFIGKWNEPEVFEEITENEIFLRKGCQVYFEKKDGAYIGRTDGKSCNRGLGNASYTIHQLRIDQDQIINWARGFDANDNLVWGKSEGGYILQKVTGK